MIDIEYVKKTIKQIEKDYLSKGYEVHAKYAENAYRIAITRNDLSVTIRDGYFSKTDINSSEVTLTSFDVFFNVKDVKFAHYISDYPLAEYPDRLNELFKIITEFFHEEYSISEKRYLLFWQKRYLNVEVDGVMEHFIEVKNRDKNVQTVKQ